MATYTKKKYLDHLQKEHRSSTLAAYLKEIVYGGNDGIVTTFAVVAGYTGAHVGEHTISFSILTVLLFGLANLFADGAAMGLGNFLSIRAEQHVYKQHKDKEWHEIQHSPAMEKAETRFLLEDKGFSKEQAEQLTEIYASNPTYWLDFMMNHELEMSNPEGDNPIYNGLATFTAFVVFGFIPLIPYLLISQTSQAFWWSCIAAAGALVLLGITSGFVTNRNYAVSILETLAVGGTSASVAFLVGSFFR